MPQTRPLRQPPSSPWPDLGLPPELDLPAPQDQTQERSGPRPLQLHLMTASALWLSWPLALTNLSNGSASWKTSLAQQAQELRRAAANQNPDKLAAALQTEALERFQDFLNGVKKYRAHETRRVTQDAPVIWREGSTRILDYAPDAPNAPVLFIVPSLINRYYVLDLDRDNSFMRWIAAQGMRPVVVDWDSPRADEYHFGMENYIARAARGVAVLQSSGKLPDKMHLLGYCMGGLLALALALQQPAPWQSLSLMASPWDFHQPAPQLAGRAQELLRDLEPWMMQSGLLQVDTIQALFTSFQPVQVLEKFVQFGMQKSDSAEARQFVLLEDWLNDGVPLTAPVAREVLRDWYGNNLPARAQWQVGATRIDPARLRVPAMVVVPGRDRIVPPESARAIAKKLRYPLLHEPTLGHIGLVVSQHAKKQVWEPLHLFLKNFS